LKEENPAVAIFSSCSLLSRKGLKIGVSMPCVDELPDGSHCLEGIPIGKQAIEGERYLIGIFCVFPESGTDGICHLLVMSLKAVDPFSVIPERGTVARKRKFHIQFPDSGQALKVIRQGIVPVQQKLDASRNLVPDDQDAVTRFIETAVPVAVTGRYQAGEMPAASNNDVAIGNASVGPGTSLPVFAAIELRNDKRRFLFRETQHLQENRHLRIHFSLSYPLEEFGFSPAYVDMRCSAEKPGDGAVMVEVVMGDEKIGASQVQTEVPNRIFHGLVAGRMSHTRIDYEIPVSVDDHIGVHGSDFRDWQRNDNPENPGKNFADSVGSFFGLT